MMCMKRSMDLDQASARCASAPAPRGARSSRRARAARPRARGDGDDRARHRRGHALGRLPVALLAGVRQGGRLDRELRPADARGASCSSAAHRPRASRPRNGHGSSTRSRGVIGGLGYLGAVVRITYGCSTSARPEGKIGVRTIVHTFDKHERLAEQLLPNEPCRWCVRTPTRGTRRTSSTPSGRHSGRAAGARPRSLFTSAFTTDGPSAAACCCTGRSLALRVPFEWIMTDPGRAQGGLVGHLPLPLRDGSAVPSTTSRDSRSSWTATRRAKRIARRLFGSTLKTLSRHSWSRATVETGQRSGANGSTSRTASSPAQRLTPTLQDVLCLPKEMSLPACPPAPTGPGYAVSYAFETSTRTWWSSQGGVQRDRGRRCGRSSAAVSTW